jgi:phosphatidylserine/phosphatidylglycerophosphate/cardiolipin synthase-like enzyme
MKNKQNNLTWIPHFIAHNAKLAPLLIVAFVIGFEVKSYVSPQPIQTVIQSPNLTCKVCFTPRQACLPMIIDEIDKATTSIHMQAYSFTSKPIADALIRAHKRGVTVVVIADKSQRKEKHTQIHHVKRAGIMVYIDTKPGISHSKIITFDRKSVLTGSYNFSNAAENRNAENVVLLVSPELASMYEDNFANRLAVSDVFTSNG